MKWLIVVVAFAVIVIIWQALIIMELQDHIAAWRGVAKDVTQTSFQAIDQVIEAKAALRECQGKRHLKVVKNEALH